MVSILIRSHSRWQATGNTLAIAGPQRPPILTRSARKPEGPQNRATRATSFGSFSEGSVKSQDPPFPVIPAKAGIQRILLFGYPLDSGLRRSDGFVRSHLFFFAKENEHIYGNYTDFLEA
jgi:hypothetical protein